MDNIDFEPFIKNEKAKIVLPDFDTLLRSETVEVKPKRVSPIQTTKTTKKKVDISNLNIDHDKLLDSKGKRGYTLKELRNFANEITRRGIVIRNNLNKKELSAIIYNLK